MKTPIVLSMKFRLVDLLRSWLLSGLWLVARCGFLLALVTGFTALPVSAAEPTNSVLPLHARYIHKLSVNELDYRWQRAHKAGRA